MILEITALADDELAKSRKEELIELMKKDEMLQEEYFIQSRMKYLIKINYNRTPAPEKLRMLIDKRLGKALN